MVNKCLVLLDKIIQFILMKFVWIYRTFFSAVFRQFGGKCRFHPSCSDYAVEALKVHGGLKGTFLSVIRVMKCGPFHPGGVDPVPPKKCCEAKTKSKEN